MNATIAGASLRDIANAVADELQLTADNITVSQVTVIVTYSLDDKHVDFMDDWYNEYLNRQAEEIEVPF